MKVYFFVIILLGRSLLFAKQNDELQKMQNEITALKQLKVQKLDQLESAESQRWNMRYRSNEELKLLQARSQQLESQYSTVAGQLNRKQEDILILKNALEQQRDKRDQAQAQFDGFVMQVLRSVEDVSEKLDSDFPYDIAARTALYSSLAEQLKRNIVPIEQFFRDRFTRVALTAEQRLTTKAVLFNDGSERVVWRLQFGTVAVFDIDKNSEQLQTLFRTGSVQGQRYMWKSSVDQNYTEQVVSLLGAINENENASVPLDVIQNGKFGVVTETGESGSFFVRFQSWFAQGGLIMYPLFLCAFLAFIISLERFVTFTNRHHRYTKSYSKLMPLINEGKWEAASKYCKAGCTGLTRAIQEIVLRRKGSRESAEQHVKQILLAEVPSLEKRLSLISALGATAPLLGLLGTVSGMITLFKVITETGTNDARILAGGISEALVTTQTGLLVAIPILLLHGYLTERLEDILSHYNETVLEVFNIVFNNDSAEE